MTARPDTSTIIESKTTILNSCRLDTKVSSNHSPLASGLIERLQLRVVGGVSVRDGDAINRKTSIQVVTCL